MDKQVLNVQGLSKKLKNIQAVSDLSFTVQKGDIYGFLGPNGSGKSTTIRLMLNLLKPDTGHINILGLSLNENKLKILSQIGAFIEKPDFYEYLTAYKNLEILLQYSGIKPSKKNISETLELVGLNERSGSKVKTFSKGMKQRLGIAQALLHDPELLILDEPASGLDPSGMKDIRELIKYLNKEKGKTIILSSHNLLEIESIANRMLIINKGKKIVEGDVKELLKEHNYCTRFKLDDADKAKKALASASFGEMKVEIENKDLMVFCPAELVADINTYLVNKSFRIDAIRIENSLEDYFLTLT
ncbi:MAG: ABC transporter ATP-binding protein [Bacteroidales bacterium]|nr:ABC transporter ATP-binding protein [Bacteroidales bacterium]MCF8405665.1 ABC transporter ATP-binding protein [Bacteroidales bacterium]